MFEQVTIWVPSLQLITDIVTAYFLIGFWPWLAWCFSLVWRDYGREARSMKPAEVLRPFLAWIMWPVAVEAAKHNFDRNRMSKPYYFYR